MPAPDLYVTDAVEVGWNYSWRFGIGKLYGRKSGSRKGRWVGFVNGHGQFADEEKLNVIPGPFHVFSKASGGAKFGLNANEVALIERELKIRRSETTNA